MIILKHLTIFLTISCLFILNACNSIWIKDETSKHSLEDFPKADQEQEKQVDPSQSNDKTSTINQNFSNTLSNRASEIEVVWRVPEVKVTSYVINYGYSRSSLDQSREVPITDLEQFEDGVNGQVYRYIFKDTDSTKPFFISIIANDNGQRSQPSEIMEVVAE